MTETMKKFLEALSGDAEMTEKVRNAKSAEEVAELAGTLGLTLTEEDFQAPEGEVSDEELEGVAGGLTFNFCDCLLGGGGSGIFPGPCACIDGGGGGSKPSGCDCYRGGGGAPGPFGGKGEL